MLNHYQQLETSQPVCLGLEKNFLALFLLILPLDELVDGDADIAVVGEDDGPPGERLQGLLHLGVHKPANRGEAAG